MNEHKHSNVSVQISGNQMTKSDVGKVAILNTYRELVRDIGNWLIKIAIVCIGAWKGGEILHEVITIAAKNWFGSS